jgi:hypothetical protein
VSLLKSEANAPDTDGNRDSGAGKAAAEPRSAPRHCPNCRLFSPPETDRCECGFDFSTQTVDPALATSAPGPSGVGGWLAFLTFGLLVLVPVATVGSVVAGTMEVEREYPLIGLVPEWTTYKVASWLAAAVLAGTSAYAGWGLAHGRTWSIVQRAVVALWVIGPGSFVVLGVLIPWATFGGAESSSEFGGVALARSVVVAFLWTVYLNASRRVKATYVKPRTA